MTQREPITDPRYVYSDDSAVIAYRLGIVETDLKSLDTKLDKVINEYPTSSMLKLLLDPIREEVRELKDKREEEAKEKVRHNQQMKYLTYAAIAGPLGTFIITIVLTILLGGELPKNG